MQDIDFKNFPNYVLFKHWSYFRFRTLYGGKDVPSKEPDPSFEILGVLGRGSFATVVSCKVDGQNYAAKIFSKKLIVNKNHVHKVYNEKKLLFALCHPNIVRLVRSFKDNVSIYLVMSIALGGELYFHLRKLNKFEERISKYIVGQVVLTLEYLHELRIAHRDIKPENIIFDLNGYIKISDFGFAKIIKNKTHTLCGTPEYLAPEMIKQRGHDMSVDWWACGVLVYEINSGFTPFYSSNQERMFKKITHGHYEMHSDFSESLKDLISGLLNTDVKKRYGCGLMGAEQIKSHEWFEDIDWWNMFQQNIDMPFKPKPEDVAESYSDMRLSNFEISSSDMNLYADTFSDF